jgi:hypothetical protein
MRYLADDGIQGGIGAFGEVAEGPDGRLYQWVEGMDGLGNPMGFWKRLRTLHNLGKRLARTALPIAQRLAPFVPGGAVASAVLNQAAPHLKRAGLLGYDGVGALYQAADGSLYGLAEEPGGAVGYVAADELSAADDLEGIDADAELDGIEADAELAGLNAEADLNGLDAEDDLRGFAADPSIDGFGAQDLDGFDAGSELDADMEGYLPEAGVNGVDAYVREPAPANHVFTQPAQDPWKPHW